MANKQIKDFGAITNGTGSSILIQNDTTGTYNKISAENIASAATVLSKAITAQEDITIQGQLILDSNYNTPPPPSIFKSTGVDFSGSDAGIIELDFTSDISGSEVWGLKIKSGSADWGIKSNGMVQAHHLMLDYYKNICDMSAVKYESSNGNNWVGFGGGIFEADISKDSNFEDVWGLKITSGSDAWGVKANGDAVIRNFEANTLDSNQINLVDMNASIIEESTILMSNHGGGFSPASLEIQNSDGATSLKIPPNLLAEKYLNMSAAADGGVPIGGTYLQVDSLSNPTSAVWSVRLI
tara:strand:+ start:973 stop:1863 length:891 start_codon:yes stop_codon:yes gene_type:complete